MKARSGTAKVHRPQQRHRIVPITQPLGSPTALLLACLWWLGGRNLLVGLALIAFLPVAVELDG